ncbi:MAG: hypothetical protein P1V97_22140, partial [Planctomycetota bacterium]|nr:hypothetical protein [Planctomycetota bacterium]
DQINVILAKSPELDASITLRIEEDGGVLSGPQQELTVGRYDSHFTPVRGDPEIELSPIRVELSNDSCDVLGTAIDSIEAMVQPLWDPAADRVPLQRIDENHWSFDQEGREPGPWLLTGWHGSHCRVRPLMIFVKGSREEDSSKLVRAIFTENLDERTRNFEEVIDELAKNASHEDWPRMLAFLETLTELPPGTFQAITALQSNTRAMALAAFKLVQDTEMGSFRLIWDNLERTPFMWPLIPLEHWVCAARIHFEDIRNTIEEAKAGGFLKGQDIDPVKEINDSFRRFETFTAKVMPAMTLIHYWISKHIEILPKSEGFDNTKMILTAPDARKQFIKEAKNELLKARSEELWPNVDLRGIRRICKLEKPGSVTGRFGSFEHRYQKSIFEAPVIAASICANNVLLAAREVMQFQQLRVFDSHWFNEAFLWFLADAIAQKGE